ncbi:MAG: hypothetical protein MK102_00195 [Fuerstiella sp.]|nr:hypothetical protein [Fuerstiella sp.]
MTAHTIRLAGPWEQQTEGAIAEPTVLPCCVSSDERPTALIRKFHRPSGLTDKSKIHIIITVDTDSLDATLNGQPIPASDCQRSGSWFQISLDVTAMLESFNALSIRRHENQGLTLRTAVIRIQDDD